MSKQIPWITVSAAQQRKFMHSKMTVGQFMKKFSQPEWCRMPDALEGGMMGCCSLFVPGKIRAYKDCEDCDLRSQENPERKTNGPVRK